MKYSNTSINTFNRCKFLYQQTRLGTWKNDENQRMILGDLVHTGLAAYRRGVNPVKAVDDKIAEYEEVDTDARHNALRIILGAVEHLGKDWETVSMNGEQLIEKELTIDIGNDAVVTGIVDWVARDKKTGYVWLFDYKVRASIDAEINEDFNLQMAIYQYLLRMNGIDTVGSICYQMRSSSLQLPKLNVNGQMSRADLVCDWDTYKEELLKNGLSPFDYDDMRVKLEGKRFYALSRSYRSVNLLNVIWNTVVLNNIYDMMLLEEECKNPYHIAPRNMSMMCRTCGVADRCQSHLRGVTEDFKVEFLDG